MKLRIMNNIFKYAAISACAVLSMTSCDDFLDKLPDDRAELNTEEKINKFLVSAYPSATNAMVMETSSDNMTDNGSSYSTTLLMEQLYRFQKVEDQGNDSPYFLWNRYYESVATANEALAAINRLGGPDAMRPQWAEAKLCRALSMFMLANTFCMGWNPEKADEYLGLPYPLEPAKNIYEEYTRGTLRELYSKINTDIEEALPYVSEDHYSVPKYHFNVKAAYAFAARFNLYYMNYDKCVEYASKVLGDEPTSVLRDFEPYTKFGRDDIASQYIRSSEKANLMLLAANSAAGRYLCAGASPRFKHNYTIIAYETYWVDCPWGGGSGGSGGLNTLYYASMIYGNNQCATFPKFDEIFEYTDKINETGFAHVVDNIFTGDETLLCRAEAYALKKDYDKAVADINLWISTHCKEKDEDGGNVLVRPVLTVQDVNNFIEPLEYAPVVPEGSRDRSMRKTFTPQGFTVEAGTQENMLQLILHMRRIETMFQGMRFVDLKRYGIEYSHLVAGEDPVTFKAGDLRGAIQLPDDVIMAGIEANPRDGK